jgi:hypothetical protein
MQFTYSQTSYLPYVPQPAGATPFGQYGVGPKVIVGPADQGILIKGSGDNAVD